MILNLVIVLPFPGNISFPTGVWKCFMHGVGAQLTLRFDGLKKMTPWLMLGILS